MIIYVQAVFHRAERYKRSICRLLNERGWEIYKKEGKSFIWKGEADALSCSKVSELEMRAELDFLTCSVIYGIKMTMLYEVNVMKNN